MNNILSVIFRNYNRLRVMARVAPVMVDMKRLNKALGEAQSFVRRELKVEAYEPTPAQCYCQDLEFWFAEKRRNELGLKYEGPCKHMLAEMLMTDDFDPVMVFDLMDAARRFVAARHPHHPPLP